MTELSHAGVKGMKWGVRKAEIKADRKTARKENRVETAKKFGSDFSLKSGRGTTRLGIAAVGALLTGPTVPTIMVGYSLTKAAGYSKGASIATSLIGGAPGGLLMSEIATRKKANAANPKG